MDDQQYREEEIARRRDATIKQMLATPPQPHSEMKIGRSRGKSMTSKGAQSKKRNKSTRRP